MTKLLTVDYLHHPNSFDIWDNGKCCSGYAKLVYLLQHPGKWVGDTETFDEWSQYQMPVAPEQLVWWGEE